jgi:hypothetical protein
LEFRTVVLGRGGVLDVMLPPVVFLLANALAGSSAAMLAALVTSGGLVLFRLLRHQSVVYALFGLGASLLALMLAQVLRRAEVFFLPDMITNLALAAGSLLSVALRRPLVAWTSHLVRRWPRDWYWHPRARRPTPVARLGGIFSPRLSSWRLSTARLTWRRSVVTAGRQPWCS